MNFRYDRNLVVDEKLKTALEASVCFQAVEEYLGEFTIPPEFPTPSVVVESLYKDSYDQLHATIFVYPNPGQEARPDECFNITISLKLGTVVHISFRVDNDRRMEYKTYSENATDQKLSQN